MVEKNEDRKSSLSKEIQNNILEKDGILITKYLIDNYKIDLNVLYIELKLLIESNNFGLFEKKISLITQLQNEINDVLSKMLNYKLRDNFLFELLVDNVRIYLKYRIS